MLIAWYTGVWKYSIASWELWDKVSLGKVLLRGVPAILQVVRPPVDYRGFKGSILCLE